MKNKKILPFGLIFEENPTAGINFIEPLYDEEQDLSVFLDKDGRAFPFVEYFGATNTKTFTKTVEENSDDDDPRYSSLNTRTLTEVHTEESDTDESLIPFLNLRTRTMTFDQTEQSDEDEDTKLKDTFRLNTKTDTRELNENSDNDDDE